MPKHESLVGRLLPLLDDGWSITRDGKYQRPPTMPYPEVPWISSNVDFACVKWHRAFFELASKSTMVHSNCLECYKVVVMPRTVEELIVLENFQKGIDHPCKCGIEIREYVARNYGGYFYCRGLEEGRERWRDVTAWAKHVNETMQGDFMKPHDTPMKVILKRGCTEFENAIPNSASWDERHSQDFENKFEQIIDFDPYGDYSQPESVKEHIRLKWLYWAHSIGDITYVQFTPDGLPFTNPPVTYHDAEEVEP